MEVKLSEEAHSTRQGSKGLLFCRMDQSSRPRGRKVTSSGMRAYPTLTVAFYGPDDEQATKVVASVIPSEGASSTEMKRWSSSDILSDEAIMDEVKSFLQANQIRGLLAAAGTIGCPHEEGTDFPKGGNCSICPHWRGKQGSRVDENLV